LLIHYAISDIGKARKNNEDYFAFDKELNLYILADGIGGHNYGEVAAQKACETVKETFSQVLKLSPLQDLETAQALLKFAIYSANKAIYQQALDDPKYKGMGTTLVVFFKFENHLLIGHVGDSRCYKLDNELDLLTEDHTFFAQKSPKSRSLRSKHFLTRSLGIKEFVEPAISVHPYEANSTYMLCSDGLSDYLPHEEITEILKNVCPLDSKGSKLLEAALSTEAKDNITFILINSAFS
jgi:PPM family protein phosphatase